MKTISTHAREHLVPSATYWFGASRLSQDAKDYSLAIRAMENAYNHVENALAAERAVTAENVAELVNLRDCIDGIRLLVPEKDARIAELTAEVEKYKNAAFQLHDSEMVHLLTADVERLTKERDIFSGEADGIRLLVPEKDAEIVRLNDQIESAKAALGEHPESPVNLARRISELRDEGRGHFHTVTRLQERVRELEELLEGGK